MTEAPQGPGWWLASDGRWYPPEAAPAAPVWQPPFEPAPSTGMNGCLKAFLIGLGALVVLAIITGIVSAIFIGKAVDKADKAHKADVRNAAKTCVGVSYLHPRELDHCANASGEVRDAGQTVTVDHLLRVSGGDLCAQVTYYNRSPDTKDASPTDWTLQSPGGSSSGFPDIASTTLAGVSLPPNGGTASGSVCFTDPGARGTYVLIWSTGSLDFDPARGIWLLPVG